MILCSTYFGLSEPMWEKILPVIISTTFVVLLFIIGRIIDRYIKSKEIRSNWYQRVIIDPNIAKVDLFYREILSQSNKSIEFLVANVTLPHDKYLVAKTFEMEKFKVIKRAFEFEFILLVQTNYPEIASDLSEHLRGIEDCTTTYLDKNNLVISDYDNLEKEIISLKHCIYGILYKPLAYKRPNFRTLLIKMLKK